MSEAPKITETSANLPRAQWNIDHTQISETPLAIRQLTEIGLYNGVLQWWDKTIKSSVKTFHLPKKLAEKYGIYGGNTRALNRNFDDAPNMKDDVQIDAYLKNRNQYTDILLPDSIRARRKILQNQLSALQKDSSWDEKYYSFIQQMGYLDAIGSQMVSNQREITVSSVESGDVSSIYTYIESPVEKDKNGTAPSDKPIAVCVTGYGNDFRSAAPLVAEIALNGQDVAHIAYPDSQNGTMPTSFINEVIRHQSLTAHAEYFKACIRKLIEEHDGRKIELWGQSTGCLVWAEALQDADFAKLIDGVVLIHPAGITDVGNQKLEYIKEGGNLITSKEQNAMYSFVIGSHRPDRPKKLITQILESYPIFFAQAVVENAFGKRPRGQVWKKVMSETTRKHDAYRNISLPNGKKILRINARHDTTTQSATVDQMPNELSLIYDGTHADTNIRPDVVVSKVFEALYTESK